MLDRFRRARKTVLFTLAVFCGAGLQSQYAYSDIVSTEALIADLRQESLKSTLDSALNRADVIDLLAEHGVSRDQAAARVAALTDAEAQQLAAHFDQLPAGGDVALLLVIIILILLLR